MESPSSKTITTVIFDSRPNHSDRCKVSTQGIASPIALHSANCFSLLCGSDFSYCQIILFIRLSLSGIQPIVTCRWLNKKHSLNSYGPESLAIISGECASYTLSAGLFFPKLLRAFLAIGWTSNRPNVACKPRPGFRPEFLI